MGARHHHRPGKIGRNDACPCGSGLKYKRCCLPRGVTFDDAEGLDLDEPPAAEGVLGDLGVDEAREMILALQEMLKPGGVLEGLRFDRARFTASVDRHYAAALKQWRRQRPRDDRKEWEFLMDLCHRDLVEPEWLRSARAALADALARGGLPARQSQVLIFALDALRMEELPDAFPGPLVMALFPVQLFEAARALVDLERSTKELARGIEAGEYDLDTASSSPEWQVALKAMQRNPKVQDLLSRQFDGAFARSLAWLKGPEPPPFLTFDMMVWFLFQALSVRASDLDPKARVERLDEAVGPMARELREYCLAQSKQVQGLDERARWSALAMAVMVEPLNVIVAAIQSPNMCLADRVYTEDAAEGEDVPLPDLTGWREDKEVLATYEADLRARGDTVAADRLAWAREHFDLLDRP